jgi:hypothetical protein
MASFKNTNEQFDDEALTDILAGFDTAKPNDPYFNNTHDKLRGDPLIGKNTNIVKAMIPFVYEGMRETLFEASRKASSLQREITNLQRHPQENIDDLTFDIFALTGHEPELSTPAGQMNATLALQQVSERDFTNTQNSMYPGLLDEFAELYVTSIASMDRLRYFHRGDRNLQDRLDIDMSKIVIPGKRDGRCNLTGYSIWAEFGTGPNLTRNQVASAPYRMELRKEKPELPATNQAGSQVFGVSFYLKHPNTMVLYQIQDIRGANVPECTTDGIVALTIAERVGKALGMEKILAYSHHSNPLRIHYPNDAAVANALKMNFDEATRRLNWGKNPETGCPNEGIDHFYKELK